VSGRTLALWVIAAPNNGKVAIYVGRARVTTVRAASATVQRKLILVSLPRSGVVKLVQAGSRPVRFDALAIER
jgi:hypothetical protein